MDPFVLSRNAFNLYCSEYLPPSIASERNLQHEQALQTLNERYEHFLQTVDRLRSTVERSTGTMLQKNQNVNSMTSKASRSRKAKKQRLPKVFITVSCPEHFT